MNGGTTCWMHDKGDEHVSARPVGVRTDRGDVIPADRVCAKTEVEDDQIVPACEVNVGWVRS